MQVTGSPWVQRPPRSSVQRHKRLSAWRISCPDAAKNLFINPILQGSVGGLAELLLLVSIMFAHKVVSQSHYSWGATAAQRPAILLRFGLSPLTLSSPVVLFIFLPGPWPLAVTATIVRLQGTERNSNEVPDLIKALHPPAERWPFHQTPCRLQE